MSLRVDKMRIFISQDVRGILIQHERFPDVRKTPKTSIFKPNFRSQNFPYFKKYVNLEYLLTELEYLLKVLENSRDSLKGTRVPFRKVLEA